MKCGGRERQMPFPSMDGTQQMALAVDGEEGGSTNEYQRENDYVGNGYYLWLGEGVLEGQPTQGGRFGVLDSGCQWDIQVEPSQQMVSSEECDLDCCYPEALC